MGALLGGGSGSPAPERYAGIQVSTSLAGQVMPLVYGRNRVPMNLIDYGNFKSTPSSSGGGKGGSSPSSFTYSAYFIAALAIGPIQGVITVWHDKSITSLTYENLALALGSTGQATWSGYPVGTPTQNKIPYSNVCYVASQNYNFGSSASMPNLTFELEGVIGGFSDAHGMYDADPSAVVTDYLTNSIHGAGFVGAIAPLTGTSNTYQAYCGALGLYTSPYENSQRSATDFMQELMQITNSDLVLTCGTLKVVPYADKAVSGTTPDGTTWSYTPNLTPLFSFGDGDYCPEEGREPVILTRKALTDTYNIVNLQYNDRADYYNQAPAGASDNWDISIRGPRAMATLSFQQITTAAVAKTAAQLILQFQLYERNTYEFRVRADYSLLEPMDYVAITDSGLGLVNQVVRITEVQDDGDNFITIKAMEVPGTVRNAPVYNWNASQGYYANFGAAPPSVTTPYIFQMPPIPGALSGGITIGMSVCGPTSSTNWGGCQVWCSADGGSTYEWVGTIGSTGPGVQGSLTASLPLVNDPDTTSTLAIALTNTNEQLNTTVTHADADSMLTLAMVFGTSTAEVMSYGSATLTSAGHYNLTYLRRGHFGTQPAAAASGSAFVRLDGSAFQLPIDPGSGGKTLYFKFLSFNSVGLQTQTLAAATAYSYPVPVSNAVSGTAAILPRGSATVTPGGLVYKMSGANAWDSDAATAAVYQSLSIEGQFNSGGASGIGFANGTAGPPPISLVPTDARFFGFFAWADTNQTAVVDGGTTLWTGASPTKNDLYQVTCDGFTVRYYFNGVLVASSQHQGLQFYGYVTMFHPYEAFSNVEVTVGALGTPSQFVAAGNCVVNNTNAMKQGGSAAWDSSIYSVIGYQTCHITAKSNGAPTVGTYGSMIGLSTSPASSPNYPTANYAWARSNVNNWDVFLAGTYQSSYNIGLASNSDVAAITYDGTTVSFWLNGILMRTASASGLTLYGFCPFLDPAGSGLNSLRFGPTTNLAVQDTAQLGANAASQIISATAASATTGSLGSAKSVDLITASGTFLGSPVGIDFMATIQPEVQGGSLNSPIQIYITRDGTQVGTGLIDVYQYVSVVTPSGGPALFWSIAGSIIVNDTPSAGAHTYAAHINAAAASLPGPGIVSAQVALTDLVLKVREYKK